MSQVEPRAEVKMERIVSEVVAPPMFPLTLDELRDSRGLPRLDVLRDHLSREGRLTPEASEYLIKGASDIYKQEPNLLRLKYPLTGCFTFGFAADIINFCTLFLIENSVLYSMRRYSWPVF
jgi:hypothetical protein